MKRDLERWSDKLTPEEERRVWSRMRGALREGEQREKPRPLVFWLRPAAAVAAAALAAVVIWQADLLTPDRTAIEELPERKMAAETRGPEQPEAMTEAAEPDARRDEGLAESEVGEAAPQALAKAQRPSGEERVAEDMASSPAGEAEQERFAEDAEEGKARGLAPEALVEVERPSAQEQVVEDAVKSPAGQAEQELLIDKKQKRLASEEEIIEVTESGREEAEREEPAAAPAGAAEAVGATAQRTLAPKAAEKSALKMTQTSGAGEIEGRVKDALGNPLGYASVVVLGTRFGAMADDKGFFRIGNMPPGTYDLQVATIGYAALVVRDVIVEEDHTTELLALQLNDLIAGRADTVFVTCDPNAYWVSIQRSVSAKVKRSEEASDEEHIPPTSFDPKEPPKRDLPVGDVKDPVSVQRSTVRRAGETKSLIDGLELRRREKKCDSKGYPSLTGGSMPVNDELADDMFFRHYGTNPFVDADEDALSTFGLDVDTGSYTIARRYINEGALPPPEAVRVEEFVNFFQKDFRPPRRDDFRIHVDGMPSPFAHVQDGSYWLLRVGIRGRVIDEQDRLPAQIVLVIDTSGSMGMGNRLELLKDSMDVLLDELRPDDEIGIVAFSTRARVVLRMTPLAEGEDVYRAIYSLRADGSTNAEHGLKLGYEMMRKAARKGRIHRIILCSDGVANEGNTGWESILENVRKDRDRITLTTIGFGMGNYNDILLEQLADAGDGQYAYVDDLSEATRVLRENLTGTLQTIAHDAKAQIEFDPRYVEKYRLLGYENRDVRDEDFRNNEVDAGEIGAGHEVTVLYEVKLKPDVRRDRIATVHLRYEEPEVERFVELKEAVRADDFWREVADAPEDLVVDACVAEFAEILRGSYWAKDSSLADVLDLLYEATERMASRPEVDELIDLVEKAIALEE